ncbi:T9SS type A sorting domain-containing protein [Spirosoma gilvum]
MEKLSLPLLWLAGSLVCQTSQAQTVFTNVSQLGNSSDNTGDPYFQPGTEVLNSFPGLGVSLAPGGSYEHVGQFFVAANGLWNQTSDPTLIGTDYFGYAPVGIGSNTAYLGKGIQGASAANGGSGAGRPTFGHLQLNSTGQFPVEGGMFITHSLRFNANGPGGRSIITTPNSLDPYSAQNTVQFSPSASVSGADERNYIQGYASVTGVQPAFMLPLGDQEAGTDYYCPIKIGSATVGTVTARYQHLNPYPTSSLETGIGSVSPLGSWPLSAPAGTRVTITLPALGLAPTDASTLRLVGWTGSQWVGLAGQAPTGNSLSGTLRAQLLAVGIGSTSRTLFQAQEGRGIQLALWPNPTQDILNLALSSSEPIRQISVLDVQGRLVMRPAQPAPSVNTAILPSGTYLVEVLTGQGQTIRKPFVKQP